MTTRSRCSVCSQYAYRDSRGRMLMHTRMEHGDRIGDKPRPVVCEGSDRGARP